MQVGLAVHSRAKASLRAFQAKTSSLFVFDENKVSERRSGRIPVGGVVSPFARDQVMLIGDAAGLVSPVTGGGIRLAFHFGRRAAQAVADHLLHAGPPPEQVLAPEMPRFALKGLMRRAIDLAPSNALIDLGLGTWPMRVLAQHMYFHRRGARGMTFAEFERQLGDLPGWNGPFGAETVAPPARR
jgi:digeranylgeranylglycerophospholipid reductase